MPNPSPLQPVNLKPHFDDTKTKLEAANSVLILLPVNLTLDNVAAGLGLYLALQTHYKDAKKITIVSPTPTTVAYQRLYSVASIENQLGSKNLVVTLNVNFDDIEQVNTDNTNGKFNIVIENKPDLPKLKPQDFTFSYRGVEADLIFTIDLNTPEDAGDFYINEKNLFFGREVISFSINPNSVPFSSTAFKDPSSSCLCELVSKLLRALQISLSADSATNLIAGIESATNNFTVQTSADTFSIMGSLLRFGGQRFHLTKPAGVTPNALSGFYPRALNSNPTQVNPVSSAPINPPAQVIPTLVNSSDSTNSAPQSDWTQPKIFKGGSPLNKG